MTLARVLRPVLVGALAGSLALTGCTASDPASPSTSASAPAVTDDATPTEAPTPAEVTPPDRPAAMAFNDAAGATAAAEYFLALYGYVYQTGDLTEWDAMCLEESLFCDDVRTEVSSNVTNELKQTGGNLTFVVDRVIEPSGALIFFEVVGSTAQAAFEVRDPLGNIVDSNPDRDPVATSVVLHMADDGQWKVRAVIVGDVQ